MCSSSQPWQKQDQHFSVFVCVHGQVGASNRFGLFSNRPGSLQLSALCCVSIQNHWNQHLGFAQIPGVTETQANPNTTVDLVVQRGLFFLSQIIKLHSQLCSCVPAPGSSRHCNEQLRRGWNPIGRTCCGSHSSKMLGRPIKKKQ